MPVSCDHIILDFEKTVTIRDTEIILFDGMRFSLDNGDRFEIYSIYKISGEIYVVHAMNHRRSTCELSKFRVLLKLIDNVILTKEEAKLYVFPLVQYAVDSELANMRIYGPESLDDNAVRIKRNLISSLRESRVPVNSDEITLDVVHETETQRPRHMYIKLNMSNFCSEELIIILGLEVP